MTEAPDTLISTHAHYYYYYYYDDDYYYYYALTS